MKRLMVVGGLAAVALAMAAQQHSPPVANSSLEPRAVMALSAPSFEPVATIDLKLTNVAAVDLPLALSASLSNQHVVRSKAWRPTWRSSIAPIASTLLTRRLYTRHVANTAMRGWGFL
jgi:hypothetical protein